MILKGSMFYGAMLLTASSVGLRLVQMLFQIYISGVMGAAGLGRMQLIMTVGSFGAVLASGGVRIATTCLAAEEAGHGRQGGVRSVVRCCCTYGMFLSLLIGAGLFILSDFLAGRYLDDPSAYLPLRIFALFLPVTVLSSVFGGYYTAAGRLTELVGLEFFEHLMSILLVVVGIQLKLFDPCTMIFLGSSLASAFRLLVLLKRYFCTMKGVSHSPFAPMMKRLIKLTLPLGLNDILRSGLSSIENIIVPKGLSKYEQIGGNAIATYGTVCGMVFPVITFPSVILYSLSDLLVPEMARCIAKGRQNRVQFLADKCLRLTALYGIAVAGLGLLFGESIGALLFKSGEAGIYIRIFSPLVVMLYLDAIVDGMLKGLSQQLYTVRYNTLTSFLDVLFLFLLLPTRGIGGYLFSFTITHAINFFLSIRRLILVTGYLPGFGTTLKGAGCCLLCVGLLWKLQPSSILGTLLAIGIFLVFYSFLALLTGGLKREDLHWLKKLIRGVPSAT